MTVSTIEQLTLLGYQNGDTVYFRAIDPNGSACNVQGVLPEIPQKLADLNQTHNIYVVVNGGGDKDADVTTGRAIFFEHDNLPKDLQIDLWQTLGLPEPTYQVDTGGKSIHSYWVLTEPRDIADWRQIQTDLLNYSDADRSIKNPSRVMRLAGFKHQKTGEISTIISRSGKTYSYEELRAVIPTPAPKSSPIPPAPRPSQPVTATDGNIPPIPIERCLAKSNRASLDGVGEGGRNAAAIALARDLIGVAEVVPSLEFDYCGKNYQIGGVGDPEQILRAACHACTPPMDDREIDTVWQSANSYAPAPAINDIDALKMCLRSWAKECLPKPVRGTTGRKNKKPLDPGLDYDALAARLGFKVVRDDDGEIGAKLIRLTLDLYDLVGDRLRLNLMSREYEYSGQPIDINNAKLWIAETLGWQTSTEDCILAIHRIANHHAYHPVREYLDGLRGKVPTDFTLLDNLATYFLGNSSPLANKMLRKKLIASVARVKQPGAKDDTLLVLYGAQGAGKSTFLETLAGTDWFCDDVKDLENKDELAKLSRNWILELAEVDHLLGQKAAESFKRFLSAKTDTYRPPYGRANIRIDRTCSFFASTNKSEFLQDATGDRRFWVIEVAGQISTQETAPFSSKIDWTKVANYRDQIWATALAAYERGDTWWLDDDDEELRQSTHIKYRESDPWLAEVLGDCGSLPTSSHGGGEYITVSQFFDRLHLTSAQRDPNASRRVTKVLQNMGFAMKTIRLGNKTQKVWWREVLPLLPNSVDRGNTQNVQPEPLLPLLPLLPIYINIKKGIEQSSRVDLTEDGQIENQKDVDNFLHIYKDRGNRGNRGNNGSTSGVQVLPKNDDLGNNGSNCAKKSSKPIRVKVGDSKWYVGTKPSEVKQYSGVLEVWELNGDQVTCKKSDGGLTSWIDLADLTDLEVAA